MTGALTRLIARATGRSTVGLRPRLPARFESMSAEPGLTEIAAETLAPRATVRDPVPGVEPAPVSQTDAPPPRAEAMRRRPPPPRDRVPQGVPPEPSQTAAPAPPPLLAEAVRPAPPEVPVPPAPPSSVMSEPSADARQERVGAVPSPDPLLPVDRGPLPLENLPPAVPLPAAAARTAPETPSEPEPEITIQIGRLDVRAQPPRPALPRKQAKARPLPSLSGYLREGRS